MEILLAIVLFFGGFTLGSINAEQGNDDTQATMATPNTNGVPDSHQTTREIRQSEPIRCHSDGTRIYRDLTVTFKSQVGRQMGQAGGRAGACPDE
jgi:hypothetical protein